MSIEKTKLTSGSQSETEGLGSSRQDLDTTRYLVLHRISVKNKYSGSWYKYYCTRHRGTQWNMVEQE